MSIKTHCWIISFCTRVYFLFSVLFKLEEIVGKLIFKNLEKVLAINGWGDVTREVNLIFGLMSGVCSSFKKKKKITTA